MANITNRQQFAEACLMKLGKPLHDVHIDPAQLDLCISNAIQFYHDYHFDGSMLTYLKRQVEANTVTITTPIAQQFVAGEEVLSSITGTKFHIYDITNNNTILCKEFIGSSLTIGETITGQTSNTTATVASSTIGDIQSGYIPVPDNILSVTRILNFSDKTTNISMFDIRYQLRLNDLYSIVDSSLVYYTQVMQQLDLLDQLLIGQKPIRFNRAMERCYIDMDWKNDVAPGDYIIMEAYIAIDPDQHTKMYNDRVFQELATAYIKRQWGTNLLLYDNIELPGGIKLNGQKIYDTAIQEISKYEAEFQSKYEMPTYWYMG